MPFIYTQKMDRCNYITIISNGSIAGGIPRANVELLENFIDAVQGTLNLDELSPSDRAKNAMLDFIILGEDLDVTDDEVMLLFRLLYRGTVERRAL